MATTTKSLPKAALARFGDQALPIGAVLLTLFVGWYALAVYLNAPGAIERVLDPKGPWTWTDLVRETMAMTRPVLPAPHEVAADLWSSITDWPLDSPRNLLYHVAVTGQSTLVGFAMEIGRAHV